MAPHGHDQIREIFLFLLFFFKIWVAAAETRPKRKFETMNWTRFMRMLFNEKLLWNASWLFIKKHLFDYTTPFLSWHEILLFYTNSVWHACLPARVSPFLCFFTLFTGLENANLLIVFFICKKMKWKWCMMRFVQYECVCEWTYANTDRCTHACNTHLWQWMCMHTCTLIAGAL